MSKKPKLAPISEDLIKERLRWENPWWITRKIEPDFDDLPRRQYLTLFYPLINEIAIRRATVLMGPRRVGKTVLMHHAIQQLLDDGIEPQKIAFVSIDNPIYLYLGLEQLFNLIVDSVKADTKKDWYVFFDEIQYLKDWEVHLKSLVDSYPGNKFIVSGSAAAALRLKSTESGAGRFTDFMLPPLTFHEYITLKNYNHLIRPSVLDWQGNLTEFYTTIDINKMNEHFVDYINFGGYPEVIFSDKIQANPARYIKNDIVDKVLLRDLPSLYGIKDVQELNAFFSVLAYYSGSEISLDSLSQSSGIDKNLIKKYIQYLESAYLVRTINRIDDNAKRFHRAVYYKIYLTNPSLRSALFSPISSSDDYFGSMVETAIFAQWLHRDWFTPYYARWANGKTKGEVDMVGLSEKYLKPVWAIEIKWSNRYYNNPAELKSLIQFCKKNGLSSALVTTIDKTGSVEYDGIKIHFVSSAMYAYTVGVNTIGHKMERV